MPRVARIAIPGIPHHVTQRGNNRQDVFFADADRRMYLFLLRQSAQKHGLDVLGYCLMPNHVHLVVTPATPDSLAKGIGRTNLVYAQYINRLQERCGHLWQNRFYSCPLGEAHCWAALRYIERNPVRAGLVGQPWDYPWSSAPAHTAYHYPHRAQRWLSSILGAGSPDPAIRGFSEAAPRSSASLADSAVWSRAPGCG